MQNPLAERISQLPSVSVAIADSLSDMIFTGQLRPGERLIQTRLAEEFGVSRLPVRDAIHLLEQRSLVVTRPRRGVVVRPIDRGSVRDIFAVRSVLEPLALEDVVARLTEEDLATLDGIIDGQAEAIRADRLSLATSLDQQFHDFLNSRAGNVLLKEMIQILWARNRQIRSVMQASDRGRIIGEKSVARHRELMSALRERDLDRARALTLQTMAASEAEILAELERLDWIDEEEDEGGA